MHIIWISTKLCITPAERMNAYMHKYAYNYTYVCNCDSLIIGKFGSSLYFVKKIGSIGCYRLPAENIPLHLGFQTVS
jgi:hypothetical protein